MPDSGEEGREVERCRLQREGDVAFRVGRKDEKERVVGLPRQPVGALDAYLVTRPEGAAG